MVLSDNIKTIIKYFKAQDGFNCLEVLLCSFIIISSISLAQLSWHTSDEMILRYEAICMINDLKDMRKSSEIRFESSYYSIDKKMNYSRFTIMDEHTYYVMQGTVKKTSHRVPSGITISMNRRDISFNPDGSCTTATVKLQKNNNCVYVIVDKAGRIRLN